VARLVLGGSDHMLLLNAAMKRGEFLRGVAAAAAA